MKFFGVHIEDLESERFLSASNDQIATWLFLHALCSKQMNGGTIAGASTLPQRFWSRHGISAEIINKPSPLWSWSGDDLTVEPYDIDGETIFIKKVKGGKAGAAKRWKGSENRSPNRSPNAPNLTRPNPTQPDPRSPEKEDFLFPSEHPVKKYKDRGSLDELKAYALEIGLPETDGEYMFDHWESNGWKNGPNKVKCWRAGIRKWKSRGWLPSQDLPSKPESYEALQSYAAELGIQSEIATSWWDKRKTVGWKVNGQAITDWQSDLFGFVETWARNSEKPNGSAKQTNPNP